VDQEDKRGSKRESLGFEEFENLMFSANSSFTTQDLGPARLDFNLETPRSEIPSHYPTINHNPCDYQI